LLAGWKSWRRGQLKQRRIRVREGNSPAVTQQPVNGRESRQEKRKDDQNKLCSELIGPFDDAIFVFSHIDSVTLECALGRLVSNNSIVI
jgi:hypothetical protein